MALELRNQGRTDMALVIEQRFPLGRFHATRWNQNPFEDPYGEWPPSPWRLLRTLAARWFQYNARDGRTMKSKCETGLLQVLASIAYRHFCLPMLTWRRHGDQDNTNRPRLLGPDKEIKKPKAAYRATSTKDRQNSSRRSLSCSALG